MVSVTHNRKNKTTTPMTGTKIGIGADTVNRKGMWDRFTITAFDNRGESYTFVLSREEAEKVATDLLRTLTDTGIPQPRTYILPD